MRRHTRLAILLSFSLIILSCVEAAAQSQPDGQLTVAFDASIASSFLDPAETSGLGTPFVFLYALHDALIKPLPGNDMAPCLAESWKESPDGLVYEFKLRENLRFHNGDPFTAEDVKFSFLRYKGISAKLLHDRVKAVEVVDPYRVRFVLHNPWPDFLVFYATPATGAAWIVPKKYIEKVGEDGFKRQPVGLGPYRFVRANPGVEVVLEANEQYWRKKPSIKRVVIKGVPDRTTRLAMLKTGEADIGYLMIGLEAATIKADPKLRLAHVIPSATWWLEFPEQWNPKSPWNDRRVRLAANLAVDKQGINEAERMGLSRITGSIIPSIMDYALRLDPYPMTRRMRSACSPMPAIRTASMPETSRRSRRSPPWARRSPTRWRERAFARASARWSGRPSWSPGGPRNSPASSRWPRPPRATPRPASRPSSSAPPPTLTAAIPTSTICSASRRRSATGRSGRRCSSRSSA